VPQFAQSGILDLPFSGSWDRRGEHTPECTQPHHKVAGAKGAAGSRVRDPTQSPERIPQKVREGTLKQQGKENPKDQRGQHGLH
jgi:hypothetical protein